MLFRSRVVKVDTQPSARVRLQCQLTEMDLCVCFVFQCVSTELVVLGEELTAASSHVSPALSDEDPGELESLNVLDGCLQTAQSVLFCSQDRLRTRLGRPHENQVGATQTQPSHNHTITLTQRLHNRQRMSFQRPHLTSNHTHTHTHSLLQVFVLFSLSFRGAWGVFQAGPEEQEGPLCLFEELTHVHGHPATHVQDAPRLEVRQWFGGG